MICLDSRGNIATPKKTPQKEPLNKSIRFDETILDEGSDESEMNKSVSNPVEMHFTLAKYLPQHAAIQTSFDVIVSGECDSAAHHATKFCTKFHFEN